ncbi:MAG TPA: DNA sulfur modification protein DndB [Candidatus Xenobia bacterium]|nr:DNA sulfur modification protein DndB [Candidatus Xenobia bacterium]
MNTAETKQLKIPGLRAQMGDWVYYTTFLRMGDIAERISLAKEIHPSKALQELIQREVESAHSDSIREYLLRQKERFFNALVIGVYGGSPKWLELSIEETKQLDGLPDYIKGALGILVLDGSEKLFAIDGQHRVVGIKKALQEKPELGDEEVSAIFVGHATDRAGIQRTRRLFTTLNRYAKPVNKMQIIALDEDDVVAIVTRRLLDEHVLFRNWTSIKKVKSLPNSDRRSFTTIITLYDVLDVYLAGDPKDWRKFKKLRPPDKTINAFYKKAAELWDKMVDTYPPLRELARSDLEEEVAARYRNRDGGHLLFRPVGLSILVGVIKLFRDEGKDLDSILRAMAAVPLLLSEEPWVGLLWDPVNRRMVVRSENQKVALRLAYHGLGGDLTKFKTNEQELRNELAGLLSRAAEDVTLPRWALIG